MKTIVVNSISFVLVSLFCCHGLADEILNGGKIEKNSYFEIYAVGSKLMPNDYLMSFFKPSIKMLDIPNKPFDYKFIIKESAITPLFLYKTSTQIPYLNAIKRITRQANTAKRNIIQANTADGLLAKTNIIKSSHIYNNTLNSTLEFADVSYNSKLYNVVYILSTSQDYATTRENSSEIIDNIIALYGFYDWSPYVTIKKHSTVAIDTMLNRVSNWTSDYILMVKKHMDLILTIYAYVLIGVFCGTLLFVVVRANQFRNARREVNQLPENICMYIV